MVFVDQQAAVIVLLVRKLIDNFFDLKKEQQANIIVEEKLWNVFVVMVIVAQQTDAIVLIANDFNKFNSSKIRFKKIIHKVKKYTQWKNRKTNIKKKIDIVNWFKDYNMCLK